MPRARRKASSPAPAPEPESEPEFEQDDAPDTTTQQLKFNQPLTGRPGKPVAVAELLKRLKALHAELLTIDQEETPRESVSKVAQELADPSILTHRDKGVRAWAACCLVEVFRTMAPDAPFTPSQLKQIFDMLITSIVPALADPSDPYNDQHVRVLASLDDVKSIILLTDIESSDHFMTKLFFNCFDLLADEAKSDEESTGDRRVEYHLTRMLATLVDESETLPADVIELILAQFLRTDSGVLALHKSSRTNGADGDKKPIGLPAAYNLAKNICTTCTERMARAIGQYFSTVIVDASESSAAMKTAKVAGKKRRREDEDSEDEKMAQGPSMQDMKELAKAHKLLRELWRSAPLSIQNVIPQLEAELSAENNDIRLIAVETVGDLISGIGVAGLPEADPLDPAAYPSQSLTDGSKSGRPFDVFSTPASPRDFASVYPTVYSIFMDRKRDKSPQIRAAFVLCLGRILTTNAGGIGLDEKEKETLLQNLSDLLQDTDDKVRLAAVQMLGRCSYADIVSSLAANGGVNEEDSVLSHASERIKDRKVSVRLAAVEIFASIWGVASGAIAEGSERARELFGGVPSKIFDAMFLGDRETNFAIQNILFESLLPLTFPRIKDKSTEKAKASSQRVKDSQSSQNGTAAAVDVDAVRAQRILVLVRDLEPKAKNAFFVLQNRQVKNATIVEGFLKQCEEYNGGVSKEKEGHLGRFIDNFASATSDPVTASDHLWKFAKKHDRRIYHLIRFCTSPESDYKKVVNAIREIRKRVNESPGNLATILPTLMPIVQQASVLVYNRSHVSTIVKYARTDDDGLGSIAHEVLRHIADNHPEVFKAHVRTMCKLLVEQKPAVGTVCEEGTVQTLKACANFALKFPTEMPQDRELLKAMVDYALHGNPPKSAKYAVSVVAANETLKDMYVKQIVTKSVKNFELGDEGSLSKLAALSQLMLLAAPDIEDQHDNITTIAIKDVLMSEKLTPKVSTVNWAMDIDDDTASKVWALKILANRLRGYADRLDGSAEDSAVLSMAKPVYTLLRKILNQDGQISEHRDVPEYQKSRVRLTAGLLMLKLSSASKYLDRLLEARDFNKLALLAQDPVSEVRSGFIAALKKYLGKDYLPQRFYTMTFLLAFEPTTSTKEETSKWLRSKAMSAKNSDNALELSFARFLSVLAHHPDFSMEVKELRDFVDYILYYLQAVANEKNLPLIFMIAQKCKSVQDGINSSANENLYCLSDLAQAVIREYADAHGWQLTALSSKVHMPTGIFAPLRNHAEAQQIAAKQYVPEDLLEGLDEVVRAALKTKKRRHDGSSGQTRKRSRTNGDATKKVARAATKPKTPRKSTNRDGSSPVVLSTERRRSGRQSNAKSYAGMDDSEDEEEDVED